MSTPDRRGTAADPPKPWTQSTESELCPFCPTIPGSAEPGWDLIHTYSRAEAIADGVLVDVSREAGPEGMLGGFAVPVAVTAALWASIQAIPQSLAGIADSRGRLHDVLWMASVAARRQPGTSHVAFAVHLPCRGTRRRVLRLLAVVGPDDDGSPCVTIGYPEDF